MSWIIATGNAHKVREFEEILGPLGIDFSRPSDLGLQLEVDEWGTTFAENAVIKALAWSLRTGRVCAADDSGLEVRHLDWGPGVHSARFAGDDATDADNNEKLLAALQNVDGDGRDARYRCVIAIAWPIRGLPVEDVPLHSIEGFGANDVGRVDDFVVRTFDGICPGSIGREARGDGGFGYDPYFVLPDGRHMAELTADEKHAISHRGLALRKASRVLELIPFADGSHLG